MRGNQNAAVFRDHDRVKIEIGRRLRRAREDMGFSMKKMSFIMELSYQSIWKYEEGISEIPITRLIQYCHFVKISANEVLAGLAWELTPAAKKQIEVAEGVFRQGTHSPGSQTGLGGGAEYVETPRAASCG